MAENLFYGWFDDAGQKEPTYDPPHPGPCLFCGKITSDDDVRTHAMMFQEGYAKRSYLYRTHRTCAVRAEDNSMDGFIWAMIERNGD